MENDAIGIVAGLITAIIFLAFAGVMILAYWKIFVKAGKPGWASLVPIYNAVVFLDIAGKPTWWILLMFIPFVNFVVMLIALNSFVQKFGKGLGFLLGLIFLSPIFLLILAFDDSTYQA